MALIERNLASKAGGFTVQKFTASMTSTVVDVTVAEAPLDKSFVVISQSVSDANRLTSANLTTTTNVRLTTEFQGGDIVFYVVTSN